MFVIIVLTCLIVSILLITYIYLLTRRPNQTPDHTEDHVENLSEDEIEVIDILSSMNTENLRHRNISSFTSL